MYGLTIDEERLLRKLSRPSRIQDFLNALPVNYELKGETCMSPRRVLKEKKAHCMEGALLAALALRLQAHEPLIMDLKAQRGDDAHVVALFRFKGRWGAIGKTNHAVLRYREPVYTTIRELALSYFHEYFLDDGRKTLRSYAQPFNLARFDPRGWMTSEKDLFYIPQTLNKLPHISIAPKAIIKTYRRADPIERAAGKLIEWNKKEKRNRLY